jgi:hypothetical protein
LNPVSLGLSGGLIIRRRVGMSWCRSVDIRRLFVRLHIRTIVGLLWLRWLGWNRR